MSSEPAGRPRRRGRQQRINARLSNCCYIDPQLGPQVFLCTEFSQNGTDQRVGEAYCCRPSRQNAYCCGRQEYQQGGHVPVRCGRMLGGEGRRFHRRNMVPRVALAVCSLIALAIIAVIIYFCLKRKLLGKRRTAPKDSVVMVGPPAPNGELITPYQQATGVYSLPASDHPVQYIGGSQCPLREYGPLQPAYPGRQFTAGPPPAMPRVTEVT